MTPLTNTEYGYEIEELAADVWEEALSQAEGDKEMAYFAMQADILEALHEYRED